MKILLLLLLLLLLSCCHKKQVTTVDTMSSIHTTCCSHPRARDDGPLLEKTLVEYLVKSTFHAPILKEKHLSDRNKLEAFSVHKRTAELAYFQSDNITLLVDQETIIPTETYKMEYFTFLELGWEDMDSILKTLDGTAPLGWRGTGAEYSTLPVPRIRSLRLNDRAVDITAINHLLFPNFVDTHHSLQPIQAYWSPDHAFIYLYIFGAPNATKDNFYRQAERTSYLAKVIINVKEEKIEGVLAVNGWVLFQYNWFCEGFIGF